MADFFAACIVEIMSLDAYHSPWTDVAAHLVGASGLAFLPFGALEQHGPHLPLGTDTAVAIHVARELAERMDGLLLPPLHYGDTWGTAGYPGTVSLSSATVTAIAVDIGRSLAGAGARGFVVINGDWGNRAPLYAAMRVLNADGSIPAIALDYPGMDDAIAAVRESAPAAPGLAHAEEVETSIILQLAPEDVRTDRYVSCYPDFPSDFGIRPMQLHEFSPSGVFGDPATASAEKGAAILAATIDESERVLTGFLASLRSAES